MPIPAITLATPKLPSSYATLVWSIPSFTEGTYSLGSAVIESIALDGSPEFITILGNEGLVAAVQPLLAAAAGTGGTKRDDEELTVTCLAGTVTAKSWPTAGDTVTISGALAPWDRINSKWMCVSDPLSASRKAEGKITLKLKRWTNVAL